MTWRSCRSRPAIVFRSETNTEVLWATKTTFAAVWNKRHATRCVSVGCLDSNHIALKIAFIWLSFLIRHLRLNYLLFHFVKRIRSYMDCQDQKIIFRFKVIFFAMEWWKINYFWYSRVNNGELSDKPMFIICSNSARFFNILPCNGFDPLVGWLVASTTRGEFLMLNVGFGWQVAREWFSLPPFNNASMLRVFPPKESFGSRGSIQWPCGGWTPIPSHFEWSR